PVRLEEAARVRLLGLAYCTGDVQAELLERTGDRAGAAAAGTRDQNETTLAASLTGASVRRPRIVRTHVACLTSVGAPPRRRSALSVSQRPLPLALDCVCRSSATSSASSSACTLRSCIR